MSVSYSGNTVTLPGGSVDLPYRICAAMPLGDGAIVLLDSNDFLNDPNYSVERRRGRNALKNALALDRSGAIRWEAEYPQPVDYYYAIASTDPLVLRSFSSYEATLDAATGRITSLVWFK